MQIAWETRFELGLDSMDTTHKEFITLINAVLDAPKSRFADAYEDLLEHTKSHFDTENELMESSNFLSIGEHRDDHNRVLAEMLQMQRFAQRGMTKIAREYVGQKLPEWFETHAASMDTALALHLR